MTKGVVVKRKRAPRTRTCPDCNGMRESVPVVVTALDGRELPGIDSRHVFCETCDSTGRVKYAACPCCGAVGSGLCQACRAVHTDRNIYIASLRCPVKEEAENALGEIAAVFDPSGTILPFNGHSEECWTTTPMNLTPEIYARCPKCSVPTVVTAKSAPLSKETELRATALDYSTGYRSGQR